MRFDDLSDSEWALIEDLFRPTHPRADRRGRPRIDARVLVNAVLWVLTTGDRWSRLPGRYPTPQTCRRRHDEWQASGALPQLIERLAAGGRTIALPERGEVVENTTAAAQPTHERLRGAFWINPEAWRPPASTVEMEKR
jgi:putative transposase